MSRCWVLKAGGGWQMAGASVPPWLQAPAAVVSPLGPSTRRAWVAPHSTLLGRLLGVARGRTLKASKATHTRASQGHAGLLPLCTATAASPPDDVHNVWALPRHDVEGHVACGIRTLTDVLHPFPHPACLRPRELPPGLGNTRGALTTPASPCTELPWWWL